MVYEGSQGGALPDFRLVQTYPLPSSAPIAIRCGALLWPSHFCSVIIDSRTGKIIAIGASPRRFARRGAGCSGTSSTWARSMTAKRKRGRKSPMCLTRHGSKLVRWRCIQRIGRYPSTPANMACNWRSFGATGCPIRGRAPAEGPGGEAERLLQAVGSGGGHRFGATGHTTATAG